MRKSRIFTIILLFVVLTIILFFVLHYSPTPTEVINKPIIKPAPQSVVKQDSTLPKPQEDTIKVILKDSVRLEDENTLNKVNQFLKKYSELNISGSVEEYLELYKPPVLLGGIVFGKEALADLAGKYFANTKTQQHYFEYTRVFSRKANEYIVYTRENQDGTDLSTGKYMSIMANKRFLLEEIGTNLYCKEMAILTFENK